MLLEPRNGEDDWLGEGISVVVEQVKSPGRTILFGFFGIAAIFGFRAATVAAAWRWRRHRARDGRKTRTMGFSHFPRSSQGSQLESGVSVECTTGQLILIFVDPSIQDTDGSIPLDDLQNPSIAIAVR